jgi:hypothetical protein
MRCGVVMMMVGVVMEGVRGQVTERMRVEILPPDGTSTEETEALVGALREALRARAEGEADPLEGYEVLGNLQAESMVVSTGGGRPEAAVDIASDTGIAATAGTDFEVAAGAGLKARVQGAASAFVGGAELQALGNVQVLTGDDADLSVEGDVGASASGAARLGASSLSGRVAGPASLLAGGGLDVGARGGATFAAESLVTAFHGDAEVTGARLGLTTKDRMSVIAGDVAMQTPGAARVHTEGASAQLDGDAKLASLSNMAFTAGKNALLSAGSVQLGASSSVDVAAGSSASVRSESIDMLASGALSAAAAKADMLVHGGIAGFAGGAVSASVAGATAEVRGDASLAAAGVASLSGESATVATSGNLTASAPGMKVHTDELELVAPRLQSTTAEAASLLTTDATLSASGTASVFAAAVDALIDNGASMQSEGDVAVRSRRVDIETQNAASVHTQSVVEAQTQRMRVRAGAKQAGGKVTVALDCTEMPELCEAVRSEHGVETFAADAAEMLGISRQRLVVHSQPTEQTGRRRVQTKPAPDTDGQRRRANTVGGSGDVGDTVGSSARRQPRSHKRLRELHKWSIGELEKWLKNVQRMPAVARAVGAERVDGRMAIEMGAEDWQELGATSSQGARLAETIQDILRLGGLPKREME